VVALIQAAVGGMLQRERQEVIRMIRKKLKAGDGRMWEMVAAYLDGKPVQRVALDPPQQINLVLQMPDGSRRVLGSSLRPPPLGLPPREAGGSTRQ
jgi:hypothetical protein